MDALQPVAFEVTPNGSQFNLIAVFADGSRAVWGDSKTLKGANRMLAVWRKRYA